MQENEMRMNFGFSDLESAIEAYWPSTSGGGMSKTERWSFGGSLLGAVTTLGAITFMEGERGLYAALLGTAIELVSFFFLMRYFVKNDLPSIKRVGPDLASTLDTAFPRYVNLMTELGKVPALVLKEKLDFLRHRVEVSQQRLNLLIGSFEKLGVFPALAGLALQLRAILAEENRSGLVGYILGSLVIGVYLLSLLASRIKLRQSFYLNILERGVESKEG